MGNSCTREADVVALSERGVNGAHGQRHDRARGRWSGYEGSVDLDTLIEAPSPSAARRRRKSSRSKSKREKVRGNSSRSLGGRHPSIEEEQDDTVPDRKKKKSWRGLRKKERNNMPATREEEEEATYNSYDDPGCMSHEPIELTHFDSDCILGTPPDSPSVIHARWGEPVDDPEESAVCTEFVANPFKLGFCVNCQKQHDVKENGDVVSEKEYKKIARPAVSKTAANALDNPDAVKNLTPRGRESDVDLAALLKQRRDILLKLSKMDQNKPRVKDQPVDVKRAPLDATARHTMFISDSSSTSLANLRRVGSTGRSTTSGPQSLRVSRTASVLISPRGVSSMRGMSKSISLGAPMKGDDDEPAQNDWL
ncbi:hypothetical protein PINS_up002052 [Pythium insidiosum]|nr:hypothetical protein PINS_up002052 [Pythium insidiosum]